MLGLVAVGRAEGGANVVALTWICVQMSDSKYSLFERLLCDVLPTADIFLLAVFLLDLESRVDDRFIGIATRRLERLGFVAISLDLALVLPLLCFWSVLSFHLQSRPPSLIRVWSLLMIFAWPSSVLHFIGWFVVFRLVVTKYCCFTSY